MTNPQDIHNVSLKELATWLRRKMYIILALVGITLMLLALVINSIKSNPNTSSNKGQDSDQKTPQVFTDQQDSSTIKIDIEGAVVKPGLYDMPNDSRIQDVLITAGGLTAKASRIFVSKNINLAQRVYDGQKIYIPEENFDNGIVNSTSQGNLISINTGTEAQLDSLPGIGPVTAQKIIAHRPYQDISELIDKGAVSQAVYSKIKDLISL